MSKTYKGWEIVKMLSEGELKSGQVIKKIRLGTNYKVSPSKMSLIREDGREVYISNLTYDNEFEILKSPVTFEEVLKSNKKCRFEHEEFKPKRYSYCEEKMLVDYFEEYNNGNYLYLDEMLLVIGWWVILMDVGRILQEGSWFLDE